MLEVPPEVARIQLTHEDDGQDYCRQGMLQISRASYGTKVYWDAINAIAQRIRNAAQSSPLPELRESPIWENISPLFPMAALFSPSPAVAAYSAIRPPRYARFVWIVGKLDELAQVKDAECLECYDPYGDADEWRPFLPDSSEPAWLIASDAAREARLRYQWCERVPNNRQELQNLIDEASDAYTPIVVVSDLWSLRLDKYQAVVSVFDKGKLDNCAVIFPWNLKGDAATCGRAEFRQMLAKLFPVQFHKPETSILFDGVSDVLTFKAELSKLLTKYIADINRGMKAARVLPEISAFEAPPQLSPTSTST
jgi:hypothetical protein